MPDIEIVPVDPLADQPESRRLFDGFIAAENACAAAVFDAEHSGWTAAEIRAERGVLGWDHIDRVALEDGVVVGMSALAMPTRDNETLAYLMLCVPPAHRRRGLGRALLTDALASARARGRAIVQAETQWRAGGRDVAGQAFAEANGFAPAQTMIRSAMALPADRDQLSAYAESSGVEDAAAFALEVAWDLPPEEWLTDLAILEQRMSTDAPLGALSNEEEHWDADRVRETYAWAERAGRHSLTVVARDGVTSGLVGFTQLQVHHEDPTLAYQQDTLVLREARGHRLGLRLKATAVLALLDLHPTVTRVRTWNADDNAHMLAVNTELGYRPEGYLRVWERRLRR